MANQQQQNQGQNQGMMQAVGKTAGNLVDAVKQNETAAWAVGGTAGAVVGSVLGPAGGVLGAIGGAFLADQWADGAAPGAQQSQNPTTAQQQGNSPRAVLQQLAQTCQQSKQQMVSQMNNIPDPAARTVYQMAINAANLCEVECNTALAVIPG